MARSTVKEQREREAALKAENERVQMQGELFSALGNTLAAIALRDAMTDRIVDLYNNVKFEEGDAILEFLPNDYARQLLDWYFDVEDGEVPHPAEASAAANENPQQGQVSDQPQQPERPDGHCHVLSAQARDVIEAARDLVSLWENPNIVGLPRAERNAAIDDTRRRLINAIHAAPIPRPQAGRDGMTA